MEAPIASIGKTDDEIFQIELNDHFHMSIGKSDENFLTIDLLEKKNNKSFRAKLTLDDLVKKSKTFKMCDNINECISLIRNISQENLISVITKNNSIPKIHFNKFMLSQEFDILLLENELNQKEIINQLSNKIKQLEEKVESLENWKKNVEKELIENYKEKKKLEKIDSIIINKKEEIEFLEICFKKDNTLLSKKNIQFNLIYRASRDGENSSVFHSKCDKYLDWRKLFISKW